MALPSLARFVAASDSTRLGVCGEFLTAWLVSMRDTRSFAEVTVVANSMCNLMQKAGYEVRLEDEDGESRMVFGVNSSQPARFTIHCYWDAEEGTSIGLTLFDTAGVRYISDNVSAIRESG
jgi:hypothetical protein